MTVAHLTLTSDVNHAITFLNFKAEATVHALKFEKSVVYGSRTHWTRGRETLKIYLGRGPI